jgi:hypothetical protein
MPCGPARIVLSTRTVNPWEPLHLREIAIRLATTQIGFILQDTSNTQGNNIAKLGLCGLVDAGSEAMKTKMWGKVTIIKLLPEGVHMKEKGRHHVRELRELHSVQEHPAASAVIKMEFHLRLKPKKRRKA